MKITFLLLSIILIFFSCNRPADNTQQLKYRVDSLEMKLDNTYKPGLGEIMSTIQMHHAKLWFAGINQNWKLSEFEIGEIKEMIQTAKKFESDRPEVSSIPMIYPVIDSVSNAIKRKNVEAFKKSFQALTNTCNSCHRKVNFEFNVITIPTSVPVTNQEFKTN